MPIPGIIAAVLPALLPSLLDKIMPGLSDIFGQVQKKEISVEEAIQKTKQIMAQAWAEVQKETVRAQRDVIIAESQSDSWLTRNWRPLTMMVFLWDIQWYVWFQPMLEQWLGIKGFEPQYVDVNNLLNLITIGLTGYVGGRSLEKAAKNFRQNKPVLSGILTAPFTSDAEEEDYVEDKPKRRRSRKKESLISGQ